MTSRQQNSSFGATASIREPQLSARTTHVSFESPSKLKPARNVDLQSSRLQRVQFSDKVKGYRIPSVNQMSKQEVFETWYSKQEIKLQLDISILEMIRDFHISQRQQGTTLSMERKGRFCTRGLETIMSKAGRKWSKATRRMAIEVVLGEQRRQIVERNRVYDPNEIAALLEEATQEARDRALLLAAEDAAFVTLNKRRSYFTPMTTAQGPEKLAATNEAK